MKTTLKKRVLLILVYVLCIMDRILTNFWRSTIVTLESLIALPFFLMDTKKNFQLTLTCLIWFGIGAYLFWAQSQDIIWSLHMGTTPNGLNLGWTYLKPGWIFIYWATYGISIAISVQWNEWRRCQKPRNKQRILVSALVAIILIIFTAYVGFQIGTNIAPCIRTAEILTNVIALPLMVGAGLTTTIWIEEV